MNRDKYCGSGIHVVYETLYNGEVRKKVYSVCKICGKDFESKNRKKTMLCPSCRNELHKLQDGENIPEINNRLSGNPKGNIETR
ncbi:MAG: hypothetical protein K5879_00510 [Lachnospiraceae bacterium]|nr:hypothetical protein [Lachnospiraceae bacterium]